jgi:hypothetical protein
MVNRITRVSKLLRLTFWLMLFGAPLVTGLFWFFFKYLPQDLVASNLPSALAEKFRFWINQGGPETISLGGMSDSPWITINASSLFLAFLTNMLPTTVLMYIFYMLTQLFRNYEAGLIFSLENSQIYKKLALGLFAKAIADCLYIMLGGLALTFQNPIGKRLLVFELSTPQISLIFIGFVVLLISWVMEEAFKISEEQALTV